MRSLFTRIIPSAEQPFSRSPHGHAAKPEGPWEYVIVVVCVIVVLVAAYLCVKFFIRPKEDEQSHIKRRILEDEVAKDRESNP